MANVNAPSGLSQASAVSGSPAYAITEMVIGTGSAAIYYGDPVAGTAGTITRATAPGTGANIVGVFYGCTYQSTAQKKQVWNNYWPGTDAATQPIAFVCNDPNATFEVQVGTTAVTQANVGSNISLNLGTGSTVTGLSGAYVETVGTTATAPFIITGVKITPPGVNGTDTATAYNRIFVGFNNQTYKAGRASV